jgi:hypothetical protein
MFGIVMENELEALFADVALSEREVMMRRLCAIALQFNAVQAARINSRVIKNHPKAKAQA